MYYFKLLHFYFVVVIVLSFYIFCVNHFFFQSRDLIFSNSILRLFVCRIFFFFLQRANQLTVDSFGYFSLGICTSLWLSLSVC